MRRLTLISVVVLLVSCKKKYSCTCHTLDPTLGFVANEEKYSVKEKNKDEAMITCTKKYADSGKATNGINCEVYKD